MPSTKKRVNLTIPDDVYEKLQEYKSVNALDNDATACLQLVVLQLRAFDNQKILMDYMKNSSIDELSKISNEGLEVLYRSFAEKK